MVRSNQWAHIPCVLAGRKRTAEHDKRADQHDQHRRDRKANLERAVRLLLTGGFRSVSVSAWQQSAQSHLLVPSASGAGARSFRLRSDSGG
jgi:hypothetical protein